MSGTELALWAMKILLTSLIISSDFIVWNLGRRSKADKFGTTTLFLVLDSGVSGFVFKELLISFLVLSK